MKTWLYIVNDTTEIPGNLEVIPFLIENED